MNPQWWPTAILISELYQHLDTAWCEARVQRPPPLSCNSHILFSKSFSHVFKTTEAKQVHMIPGEWGLRANWYDYSRNIIFPKSPFFSSLLYCLPFHSPWLLLALHKTFLSLVSFCLCFPVRKYCGIWNKQANKQQTVCVLRTVPAFQSVLSICIINHIQLWFSAKVRMFSRGKWYCLQMFGVCVCVCVLAYSCVHVISSYWHHTVNKSHADPKSQ